MMNATPITPSVSAEILDLVNRMFFFFLRRVGCTESAVICSMLFVIPPTGAQAPGQLPHDGPDLGVVVVQRLPARAVLLLSHAAANRVSLAILRHRSSSPNVSASKLAAMLSQLDIFERPRAH